MLDKKCKNFLLKKIYKITKLKIKLNKNNIM